MATGRIKKEDGITVGVVLVLTEMEADFLRGFLQNALYSAESKEQYELRSTIFYSIPSAIKKYPPSNFDYNIPF